MSALVIRNGVTAQDARSRRTGTGKDQIRRGSLAYIVSATRLARADLLALRIKQPVAFLEEKAREMGLNAMHLEVERGDAPGLELYRRGSRSITDDKMAEPRIAETFHRAMPLE